MFDVVGKLEKKIDTLFKIHEERVYKDEDVVDEKGVAEEEDFGIRNDVCETKPVERRRGRPRKVNIVCTIVNTTKHGPRQPPEDNASSTTPTTLKRGRGRPPKIVVGEAKPIVYPSLHPLHQVSDNIVEKFKSWCGETKSNLRSGVIYTKLVRYPMVSIDWMDSIQRPRRGITSYNLFFFRVILGLLMYKAKMKPALFLPRWTVMDTYAWSVLSEGGESWHRIIVDYVSGERPEDRKMPWEQVDKIYGIAWLDKNHFVAYCIDALQNNIVVFDSISGTKRWPKVREKFRLFSMRISVIFQELRGDGCNMSDIVRPWDVVEAVDSPQQANLCDCGVISLKVIESLVVGSTFPALDEEFCKRYRQSHCIDLYRLSDVA